MLATGFVLTVLYALAETSGNNSESTLRIARHVLFPGESRNWRTTVSECDSFLRDKEGWIFSPNYPSNYDDNRVCNFVIERMNSDTCKVELTLVDFDVDESPGCKDDFLDLSEGLPGQRICGNLLSGSKKTLRFPRGSPSMTLRFRSNGEKNRKGFMLQVKQMPRSCSSDAGQGSAQRRTDDPFHRGSGVPGVVPNVVSKTKPGWCHHYITGYNAKITSPGYPSRYAPKLQCSYTIKRADSSVCKAELKFRQFQLDQTGAPCGVGDFLELPDRTRLCGVYSTTRAFQFPPASDFLFLSFVTDNLGSGPGFNVEVRQVPNSCTGFAPTRAVRCDREISSPNGRILSPGYPGPYGNNERCVFLIKQSDPTVCFVELEFRSFNIERGLNGCDKDFLLLPDGSKLCGYFNGKKLFDFPADGTPLLLFFSSDSFGSSNGFEIYVNQERGSCSTLRRPLESCDLVIHNHAGIIQSPSYPGNYGKNRRCSYIIHKADPSVCTVDLDFHTFNIEGSGSRCTGDFLQLPDGSRLCGTVQGTKVLEFPAGSDTLTLTFISDDFGSGSGFDIHVHQRKHSCTFKPHDCSLDIGGPSYRVASPGYPSQYGGNLRCRYTIRQEEPDTCRVELDFADFDVEESLSCQKDYLELPDRTRMCGKFKGKKFFDFEKMESTTATLYFVSDAFASGKGFDLIIRQHPNSCSSQTQRKQVTSAVFCDRRITGQQDILTSPSFPDDYPNDLKCNYVISRYNPEVCYIELQFLSFDVEESHNCTNDYLAIEDTGERLCGVKSFLTKVIPFPSGSETLTLTFKSDKISNRRGFDIRMHQLLGSCYRPPGSARVCGSTKKINSVFKSDNYPSPYNPNTDCYFYVRRNGPETCQAELFFTSFEVGRESQSQCEGDFVEIQGVKYCGEKDGQTVVVDFARDRNDIAIRFKTDDYEQKEGFHISVKQMVGSCNSPRSGKGGGDVVGGRGGSSGGGRCDQTFAEETFQIMSPGYQQAGQYGPSQDCHYSVRKSSFDVCALEVRYSTFLLQESEDCKKDYLEIDDQRICGKLPYDSVRTYQFPNDELVIKFHSDEAEEKPGFFLIVKQVKC